MRYSRRTILFAGLSVLAAGAILFFFVMEGKKSHAEFCVSCHLTPYKKLHQGKYNDFKATNPQNMAALHQKEIPCVGCHESKEFFLRLTQARKEVLNTLVYFLWSFKEPKKLSPPYVDGECEDCHKRLKAKEMFHAASAHKGEFPVRCTECHLSHEKGGKKERYFIPRNPLKKQCRRCHRDYPRAREYLNLF